MPDKPTSSDGKPAPCRFPDSAVCSTVPLDEMESCGECRTEGAEHCPHLSPHANGALCTHTRWREFTANLRCRVELISGARDTARCLMRGAAACPHAFPYGRSGHLCLHSCMHDFAARSDCRVASIPSRRGVSRCLAKNAAACIYSRQEMAGIFLCANPRRSLFPGPVR